MNTRYMAVSGVVLLMLAVFAGVILLQIYLSKRESKWLGFILPVITFLIAVMTVLGMAVYIGAGGSGSLVLQVIVTFCLCNIPTVILLGIYAACREKLKKYKEVDKMSIQDLD